MRYPLGILMLAGLLAASGCGLKGELERPPPLWGDPPLDGPDDPRREPEAEETARTDG